MAERPLYIQIYSLHGLVRSRQMELGRDADTGGQIKYVVELGKALSERPEIGMVELVTRWIQDKRLSPDYARPVEQVNDKFRIVRIQCGGGRYIRKELLWEHLEEFVDRAIKHIKSVGRLPDVIHSHYADAGFVCSELTKFFGIPFVHTGHSLGKPKLEKLLGQDMTTEEIDGQYHIFHRIEVEESILHYADLIVTSTSDEGDRLYGDYANRDPDKFAVIPPGVELERFFPFSEERVWSEEAWEVRKAIRDSLWRFFMNMNQPLILTICRPDKRKNIAGLIRAFGEDPELQTMANLAIFAGIRKDIQDMPDNEREVLTEMLMLMDKYDLYGKMAAPKRHDVEYEVPELYRIAAGTGGVFVNSAFTENFGITLIEAAASGLPAVSTGHGGPQDIIRNLDCGLLVEVNDFTNISTAIKKILTDRTLWKRLSENGIARTGTFYSWTAHAETYLAEIKKLRGREKSKRKTFSHVGKKMIDVKRLIVSDIDNTLLGDGDSLVDLLQLIQENHSDTAFGVATGRTLPSALAVLEENGGIRPDFLITSVGAELYYNDLDKPVLSTGWNSHISYLWNRERIFNLMRRFRFLEYQEEENQRKYKVSYYVRGDPDVVDQVRRALIKHRIKCSLIFSAGQFLDLLPLRASKGRAVRYLAYRWNISHDAIVVCGDSGNDEDMLTGEMLGVVVANHSDELERLRGRRRIYFARRPYAGGIIEGLRHYGMVHTPQERYHGETVR